MYFLFYEYIEIQKCLYDSIWCIIYVFYHLLNNTDDLSDFIIN